MQPPAARIGQVIGEIDAGTWEVIAAVGNIAIAINEHIASQTIAQGVEQIAHMAKANHSAVQATTGPAQALRDRAARLDKALARFRVA